MKILLFLSLIPLGAAMASSPPEAPDSPEIAQIAAYLASVGPALKNDFGFSAKAMIDRKSEGCMPDNFSHSVRLCENIMRKQIALYGIQGAMNASMFIYLHEFSHILMDTYYPSAPNHPSSAVSEKLQRERGLTADAMDEIAYNIQHENVDMLAAKLMRRYHLPLDRVEESVRDMMDLFPSAVDPKDQPYYTRVQKSRSLRLAKAYSEGLKNWSEYRKLSTPCTDAHTHDTFLRFGGDAFQKDIGGNQVCDPFPNAVIEATLVDYIDTVVQPIR